MVVRVVDWARYDRVCDLLDEAPRPWIDSCECDECGSQFPEHRCHMESACIQ